MRDQAPRPLQEENSCSFAHSQSELNQPPDLRCTKLCPSLEGGECFGEACPFAHSAYELRGLRLCPPRAQREAFLGQRQLAIQGLGARGGAAIVSCQALCPHPSAEDFMCGVAMADIALHTFFRAQSARGGARSIGSDDALASSHPGS